MAKRPEPGAVKTRMCPPLAPAEAAELYAAMLADVLETSGEAAQRAGAHRWLVYHPPDADSRAALARDCPPGWELRPQCGPDLGARLQHAAESAAAAGFERVLLRGSDSPAIPAPVLVAALEALDDCELAVGPDSDGGYAWIALARVPARLFDHAMSTDTVLRDTLARAAAAGLTTRQLAPQLDLDTASDLRRLAEARREGEAESCPRTLAVLDARDHWSRLP